MKRKVIFWVDTDIYEKFCITLNQTNEMQSEVVENCMRLYIEKSLKMRKTGNLSSRRKDNKDFRCKAVERIPVWALKPLQYNHKIIRSYFEAEDIAGEVTISMMEKLCSDKDHPELYVPTFRSNYSQMKLDGPKTHGKVFEDNGETVWIWSEIENVLMQYKSYFYRGEE